MGGGQTSGVQSTELVEARPLVSRVVLVEARPRVSRLQSGCRPDLGCPEFRVGAG